MTVHLVKLCVGADSIDDLIAWQRHVMTRYPTPVHHTRMTPKRIADLLDGGSIYWVIKRQIRVRQRLDDIRTVTDSSGRDLCELVLDPTLVPTELQPKKPFQGWRYLTPEAAPADARGGTLPDEIPADLGEALKKAMVW